MIYKDITDLIKFSIIDNNINLKLLYYEFIQLWIKERNLENYLDINNCNFYYDENTTTKASYRSFFNHPSLNYITFNMANFKSEDNKIFTIISFLKIILHELEHTYQLKIILENNKENENEYELIKRELLNLSFLETYNYFLDNDKKNLKKYYEKYHKLYIYDPNERLANIESLKILKDIILSCYKVNLLSDSYLNNLIFKYESEKTKKMLIGYKRTIIPFFKLEGPSIYYLKQQIKEISKDKLNMFMHNTLSEEERLILGLPVSNKTITRLKKV